MKSLRLKMPADAGKPDALLTAAGFHEALAPMHGVDSITLAGQHTAADGRLFFNVSVEDDELPTILQAATDFGMEAEELAEFPTLDECLNCGNVPDQPVAVCPNCRFREIDPCPQCHTDVPRQQYSDVAVDVLACPICHTRVRLVYAEPLWRGDGHYNEPVVLVRLGDA